MEASPPTRPHAANETANEIVARTRAAVGDPPAATCSPDGVLPGDLSRMSCVSSAATARDLTEFDTPTGIQHAAKVAPLMVRLAVLLLALTTTTGSLRLCDGWKATPEARMDCCAKSGVCPMRDRR